MHIFTDNQLSLFRLVSFQFSLFRSCIVSVHIPIVKKKKKKKKKKPVDESNGTNGASFYTCSWLV